jgi:hypothetical protein
MSEQVPADAQPLTLLEGFAEAIDVADPERLRNLFAPTDDAVYVGSEEREVAFGPELRVLFDHGLDRDQRYRITWARRWCSSAGNTALLVATGTIAVADEAGSRATPLRLTGAARRFDQGWRFVQVHCSEPVGDFWRDFSGVLPEWAHA